MDNDEEILKYIKLIAKEVSIDFSGYNEKFLVRRIKKRMSSIRCENISRYYFLIKNDEIEKKMLLNDLAVNVTNFMRDMTPFVFLKNYIIPEILKNKKKGDEISVWSAGCASGEEPYSIAIIFLETLGEKIEDYNFFVLGTDRNDVALKVAEVGMYENRSLHEMNKEMIDKYLTQMNERGYRINQTVKKYVHFKKHNLLEEEVPGLFDIIFCRNTVIYFSKESKEELYLKIGNHLKQKGFFVMGKTETLTGPARDKFEMAELKEKVYRKI